MTDDPLITEYLASRKRIPGYQPRTLQRHQRICRAWQSFLEQERKRRIESADPDDLLAFICYRQATGVKNNTVRNELCVLRTFYHWLRSLRMIGRNPAVSLPELICEPPAEKVYLTVEECTQLLSAFDKEDPLGLRNYVMIALLWSTGLRNRELCQLRWADIDLDEGALLVRHGKGGKQRQIFLNDRIHADLKAYRQRLGGGDGDPVFRAMRPGSQLQFASALSSSRLVEIVREHAKRVGLKKPINPLTFRHTFATHMFEAGATIEEIKEILGHDLETESTIYVHVSLSAAKQLLNDHIANRLKYWRS